jgi:hypothetical protein
MDPEKAALRYPDVVDRKKTTKETMDFIWDNLKRPFLLLTRSLICFLLSLYMALYVMISGFRSFTLT